MVVHIWVTSYRQPLMYFLQRMPPSLQQKPSDGADVPINGVSASARNGVNGSTVSLDNRPPDEAISSSAAAARHSQPSSGNTPQGNSHAASSQTRQHSGGGAVSAVHTSVRMPSSSRGKQGSTDDGLSKGTFRGSPVTDLQLASDVNRNTVRALRTLGPSDFQAVREIGQGAFGKVCPSLTFTEASSHQHTTIAQWPCHVLQLVHMSFSKSHSRPHCCNTSASVPYALPGLFRHAMVPAEALTCAVLPTTAVCHALCGRPETSQQTPPWLDLGGKCHLLLC